MIHHIDMKLTTKPHNKHHMFCNLMFSEFIAQISQWEYVASTSNQAQN